jgi:hypothetical protein
MDEQILAQLLSRIATALEELVIDSQSQSKTLKRLDASIKHIDEILNCSL